METGVLAKTKHNEVAPAQHEIAPIFSTTNISSDHNQLTMEVLKKVADHHGLYCLLHEKPYEGINGSGKHNNWSIGTSDGELLLKPGKKPEENVQFLLFLAAVIKALTIMPIYLEYLLQQQVMTTDLVQTRHLLLLFQCISATSLQQLLTS